MAELRLRHDDGFFLYLCSFLLLLCAWSYYKWDRYEKRHLPPGPPGEFLLGHLRIIPKENTAQKYAEWGKQYGQSPAVWRDPPATLTSKII